MTNEQQPRLSITISLPDIYNCLCPSCKAVFIDLLGEKAVAQGFHEALRRQLEAPIPPPSGGGKETTP